VTTLKFVIIYSLLFFSFFSCSKNEKEKTITRIVFGMGASSLSESIMLYGKHNTQNEGFASFIPANTNASTFELSNGDWNFAAFIWPGSGDTFQDPLKCDLTSTVSLEGGEKVVRFTLSAASCTSADLSPDGLDATKPIALVSCNKLDNVVDGNSTCDGMDLGWSRSFKVGLNHFSPGPLESAIPSDLPMLSDCLSMAGVSSVINSVYNLPLGGDGTPIAYTVVAFDGANCDGASRYIKFNDGIASGDTLRSKVFDSASYTKFFFLDKGPESLELIDTRSSASCDEKVRAIKMSGETIMLMKDPTGTYGYSLHTWDSVGSINLLKDTNSSGNDEIYDYSYSQISNNLIIFGATDGSTSGREIWKTDGTSAGTSMIQDIESGSTGSSPGYVTKLNNLAIFTALTSAEGREPWVSDGTSGGTQLLKNIKSGSNDSTNGPFIVYANEVYFSADDGTSGAELWKTDGTPGGTIMAADVCASTSSSSPHNFAVYDGKLYFAADGCGGQGIELYKWDGSNVTLVADLNSGSGSSSPRYLYVAGGLLFFSADDGIEGEEFYKFDGTTISLVANVNTGGGVGSSPKARFESNGYLYFSADDGTTGTELYSYKISDDTVTFLGDLATGSNSSILYSSMFVATPHYVYFSGKDSTNTHMIIYRTTGVLASTLPSFYPIPLTAASTYSGGLEKDDDGRIFAKFYYNDSGDFAHTYLLR
jgi:ELWxxDGT repeat protein